MKLTPTLGGTYSGSLGGFTASHNAGGLYLRRRSIPTNPNTTRQQVIRSAMGNVVQHWSMNLSEAQRQAWRDYAANTPVTNTMGQVITLSGINMFARTNVARLQRDAIEGLASGLLDTAPTLFNTGESPLVVEVFSGIFTTPPGTLTLSGLLGSAASDDGDLHLFIAAPQTPGTRFYKGPYQYAAAAAITATDDTYAFSAVDLATDWFSSTVPVAGWDGLMVPIRMRVLYDDGRLSEVFEQLVEFTDATP